MNAVPALVQSIGSTMLDISLPPPGAESFKLVFETNGICLDTILPNLNAVSKDELEGTIELCNSLPFSDVLMRTEASSKLLHIAQLSAWVSLLIWTRSSGDACWD